jgi:D-alanyl-D-alanine carboxypeptidase
MTEVILKFKNFYQRNDTIKKRITTIIIQIRNGKLLGEKRSQMKRTRILLGSILIIGLLIVGTSLFIKQDKTLSYNKELTRKVGEEVPEQIEYKMGKKTYKEKIIWSDLQVEDGNVYYTGTYKGMFLIKKKLYEVTLIVTDDVAPIIEGVQNIEIYEDEELDLLKAVKVTDNSHDEVSLILKGEYDITKKGEYLLTYEAKDKVGNVTTKEFTLTVKEKVVEKPNGNTNASKIVGTTKKGYKIEMKNGAYYINNILIANKTYSLPSTYAPGLLPELNNAFEKLKNAAAEDGISLKIISGFRSYHSQNSIYNNYVARDGKKEADTYSARPGHSEHQTGLAIDVNSLMFDFGETKEGKWLQNHAHQYGFIIRYPEGKEAITGYRYEPWHLRYVGELSKELYNDGNWITLEEYLGITSNYQN